MPVCCCPRGPPGYYLYASFCSCPGGLCRISPFQTPTLFIFANTAIFSILCHSWICTNASYYIVQNVIHPYFKNTKRNACISSLRRLLVKTGRLRHFLYTSHSFLIWPCKFTTKPTLTFPTTHPTFFYAGHLQSRIKPTGLWTLPPPPGLLSPTWPGPVSWGGGEWVARPALRAAYGPALSCRSRWSGPPASTSR